MKRRLLVVGGLAVGLVLLAWPAAVAKDLGTDVLGNIAPVPVDGGGTLVDRYPLSAFALDFHTQVGITQLDGVPATIAHWAAAQTWSVASFLAKCVIDLFGWAFSLDLLNGAQGALAPVADAVSSIYDHVLGQAWMVAAIVLAGGWGIWKALVQRRYTETVGALCLSVVCVLIALFFVYQPERTIGTASKWTNTMSLAFLSGANRGTVDDPAQARRDVSDRLFETLIYKPWVVLEFGGLRHCVDVDRRDEDGYPRPVGPNDPSRDVCRDHLRQGADGHGGYAPRFLRYAPGSRQRNAEYDALRTGENPPEERPGGLHRQGDDPTPQFAGYKVDKSDSPAVDIQQEHGAFQRLTLAMVIFAGSLGAVVLLGFLSLAVILAQVVALVLLGFAPVALVIAIFPGAGHEFFKNWLGKLATAVFIKALYSLVIAIVVAVAAALDSSTQSLGFLFSFGLQALFFWAIFLYRRQITTRLVAATTGIHYQDRLPRMTAVQRGADIAAHPFQSLVGYGRQTRDAVADHRQQTALVSSAGNGSAANGVLLGDLESRPSSRFARRRKTAPAAGNGHDPASADTLAVAAFGSVNGNGASANGDDHARRPAGVGHDRHDPTAGQEPSPRAVHEEVMRRRAKRRRRPTAPQNGRPS